jgi:hypothetical protein
VLAPPFVAKARRMLALFENNPLGAAAGDSNGGQE